MATMTKLANLLTSDIALYIRIIGIIIILNTYLVIVLNNQICVFRDPDITFIRVSKHCSTINN